MFLRGTRSGGMNMQRLNSNRGVALPLAIFALVVVGALVAGSFFIGMQEQRVGRNTVALQQAFAAAEAGAQTAVIEWDPTVVNQLTVGTELAIGGTLPGSSGWYRGAIRRLNEMMFLVRAEGFSPDSQARQQVGLLVRLRPVEVNIQAALETQGQTKIGGSSYIDGNDNLPSGWTDCPSTEPPLPGIRINDSDSLSFSGCGGMSCIAGDPQVEQDPTINDSTLTTFGDLDFDGLRELANKFVSGGTMKIEPAVSGTACLTGTLNNWGSPLDPSGPCGGYFPIVWSEGDLNINGDQGQGVLIVNGNLRVQGNFEFFGPVLIRGTLETTGTGGHFNGGVIAANVDLDQNTVLGDAVVNYSSCALAKALKNSAQGALLRDRSWINLY